MGIYSGEQENIIDELSVEGLSLETIYFNCLANGVACAIYKLPKSESKHLIIDLDSGRSIEQPNLEEIGEGFIFHPFSQSQYKSIFINKDVHIVDQGENNIEILHANGKSGNLKQILSKEIGNKNKKLNSEGRKIEIKSSSDAEKDAFLSLVKKTISAIENESFQKAVVARNKDIALPEQFEEFELFSALTRNYKNAFIYLTHIPKTGTWLGATPETLIQIDRNRQFKTVALAATQAKKSGIDPEETTWSQKDIEEQAMVSRYIINCFKKIRLREFEEVGPRTHISGNLVHLKTDYIVEMDQIGFPQLGTVMLDLLHPTSAVCGMPKEPAMSFIENNEGFDRGYFSGYLGPVNILDETHIFVNLRCMKLLSGSARLFAGAGIIANSIPEKEWNETEIKFDTLIKVLEQLY